MSDLYNIFRISNMLSLFVFIGCGLASLRFVVLLLPITMWHMPFVHQRLMCAMEETFCKKRGVKFANINLVSN